MASIHIKKSHEGRLHTNTGTPQDQKIPMERLQAAKHSDSAAIRKQATFAINQRSWHHGGRAHAPQPRGRR